MLSGNRSVRVVWGAVCCTAAFGCASRETANVNFSYVVEKAKGLPPGMKTIAIMPAQVEAATDPKWSDMSVTILQSLIDESRAKFGTPITVTERRDTKPIFNESDLAAAGLSTKKGGADPKLVSADGILLSRINVKVETHTGKQRTLSGLDISGFGRQEEVRGPGGPYRARGDVKEGGGRVAAQTEEVETVTRNMTVQTEFKLVDGSNGRIWEHYSPRVFRATERTQASPIFGSSQTEAALTPQDRIIATLVERGAREFVSVLMPVRVDVEAQVVSSNNPNSAEGVRRLRAEDFPGAVQMFDRAMAENPGDHQAAFGAGVASEALGNMDAAVTYYNRACAGQNNRIYTEARDRAKAFANRVRKA